MLKEPNIEKNTTENKEEILKMIKSPSIIQKKSSEKSLSDSSIMSYNNYADLLNENKKENEKKIFSEKIHEKKLPYYYTLNLNKKSPKRENKKISKLNKLKSNNSSIKQKIQELKELNINNNIINNDYKSKSKFNPYNAYTNLDFKTESNQNNNYSKSLSLFMIKMEGIKNKNETLKKINKDFSNNSLQKKGKKLLNGFISSKFDEEDDIEEFKNQFEIGKKSPFGCLDFQRKFKSNYINKNKNIFSRNKFQNFKQSFDDIYF